MNTQIYYDRLIERAQRRVTPDGYYEKHHIIPRSIGGSDERSNIVKLTLKEHRFAHLLLFRIHRVTNPHLVFGVTSMYEDANPVRIEFRKLHKLPAWIKQAASKYRIAAQNKLRIELGRAKTARFNALPIEERRRKVGLA